MYNTGYKTGSTERQSLQGEVWKGPKCKASSFSGYDIPGMSMYIANQEGLPELLYYEFLLVFDHMTDLTTLLSSTSNSLSWTFLKVSLTVLVSKS